MTALSLPSTDFNAASFRLSTNTLSHTSTLNKTTQTVEFPSPRWRLEVSLPPLVRAGAAPWKAFLLELNGEDGRFYAGDPRGGTARGAVGTSVPLVKGGSQTGKTLDTDGWDTGITDIFLAGDYFALDLPSGGRSLHMAITDHDSDGSGNVTLSFRPPLRESPVNDGPLIIVNPTCIMKLIDDEQADWSEDIDGLYQIAFAAEEAFA